MPEPSDLGTTTISVEGSGRSGFSSLIFGSSHFVILPENMSERIGPVSLRPFSMPATLYAATTEPIVPGMCTRVYERVCISSSVSGASLTPLHH